METTNSQILEQIGKVITLRRKYKNMTQEELSNKINVKQATLSRYELGQVNIPVLTLEKIANSCNFKMVDYFIFTESPSEMWKTVIDNRRLKKSKKTEEDIFFDEYIKKPHNKDKALALYHASRLVEYIPDSEKDNYRYAIESTILAYETNNTYVERLTKYFEAIHKFREDS